MSDAGFSHMGFFVASTLVFGGNWLDDTGDVNILVAIMSKRIKCFFGKCFRLMQHGTSE